MKKRIGVNGIHKKNLRVACIILIYIISLISASTIVAGISEASSGNDTVSQNQQPDDNSVQDNHGEVDNNKDTSETDSVSQNQQTDYNSVQDSPEETDSKADTSETDTVNQNQQANSDVKDNSGEVDSKKDTTETDSVSQNQQTETDNVIDDSNKANGKTDASETDSANMNQQIDTGTCKGKKSPGSQESSSESKIDTGNSETNQKCLKLASDLKTNTDSSGNDKCPGQKDNDEKPNCPSDNHQKPDPNSGPGDVITPGSDSGNTNSGGDSGNTDSGSGSSSPSSSSSSSSPSSSSSSSNNLLFKNSGPSINADISQNKGNDKAIGTENFLPTIQDKPIQAGFTGVPTKIGSFGKFGSFVVGFLGTLLTVFALRKARM